MTKKEEILQEKKEKVKKVKEEQEKRKNFNRDKTMRKVGERMDEMKQYKDVCDLLCFREIVLKRKPN